MMYKVYNPDLKEFKVILTNGKELVIPARSFVLTEDGPLINSSYAHLEVVPASDSDVAPTNEPVKPKKLHGVKKGKQT